MLLDLGREDDDDDDDDDDNDEFLFLLCFVFIEGKSLFVFLSEYQLTFYLFCLFICHNLAFI